MELDAEYKIVTTALKLHYIILDMSQVVVLSDIANRQFKEWCTSYSIYSQHSQSTLLFEIIDT
jgi:hypothetical protein